MLQVMCLNTYQSLVPEGVIHTPDEEPEWPQVLKPEFQHKVSQKHQSPHHQEFQVKEGTVKRTKRVSECDHLKENRDKRVVLFSHLEAMTRVSQTQCWR